ncbi:MAG TPA: thioredoxin family protein [Bacteroidales bacterium]|nr:thioredoxin family protein [Bacteroidales bacterium]HRZ76404.1 thioredoxin family protein [Bacteroidales bacterium]
MMEIKVLGTGCPKCKQLEHHTREALAAMGLEATVEKVDDIMDIMAYGIARTPGLVVDGKVVMNGRVPSVQEIMQLLKPQA